MNIKKLKKQYKKLAKKADKNNYKKHKVEIVTKHWDEVSYWRSSTWVDGGFFSTGKFVYGEWEESYRSSRSEVLTVDGVEELKYKFKRRPFMFSGSYSGFKDVVENERQETTYKIIMKGPGNFKCLDNYKKELLDVESTLYYLFLKNGLGENIKDFQDWIKEPLAK